MNRIIPYLIAFLFIFTTAHSYASDSLYVKINKHEFKKGDTINFEANFYYDTIDKARITLNVWIENVDKSVRYKFRYPLINGYVEAALVIQDSIPDGNYAVNFLVQKDLMQLRGRIKNFNPKSKGVNYLMIAKKKMTYFGMVNPDPQGYFKTSKLLFEDTAKFIFSEIGRKTNNLYIDLNTMIDSTFSPLVTQSEIITVGNPNKIDTSLAQHYAFDINATGPKFTLKEVVVKSVKKSKMELYDETYSSGLFKFGSPTVFDGIESDQIMYSIDVFNFLQARVPGLQVTNNMGSYELKWRGGPVDIFLDEFPVDTEVAHFVNTSDIAMIKLFAPATGGPSGNGTIAIYTKRGAYADDRSRRYFFAVKGYTPYVTDWK
jgi:hypothetical protein